MRKILFKRGKVAAAFITMLFVTTLVVSFMPMATTMTATATATATPTINIDPKNGTVGTEVKVDGTIDTLNGSYTVRWDKTINVTTGYAVEYNVATSFVIRQTVGAPFPGREVLVELIDDNKTVDNIVNTTFRLYREYHIKAVAPPPPSQLREGQTTDILVNVTGGEANTRYWANITVTDPLGRVYYNDTLQLTNTTNTGTSEGSITYPANFSLGANTNYVGTYNIAFNKTLANGSFTVGLTDKREYRRGDTVDIRGSGYNANETVTLNITIAEESVEGYPKNVTADIDGVVTDSWVIFIWETMEDVKPGTYTVTLTNATKEGTYKKPADAQNFTVLGAVCLIQALNLAVPPGPLANVTVVARNVTTNKPVDFRDTNETGWAEFPVDLDNYTFEAELEVDGNVVIVGSLRNQSFTEIKTYKLNLTCWIAHLKVAISPPPPSPIPHKYYLNLTLTYLNITLTDTTMIEKHNLPTNISYTIEARRYGFLFYNETLPKLTTAMNVSWVNITITLPTYTMFVHVLDSKGLPLQNVEVAAYEWSSGVADYVQKVNTNDWGSATLRCTFGKYKIWVYSQNRTVVLNKTVADLIEDRLFIMIHCKTSNVDLSVVVKDYLGNPIPNALVKVEREGQEGVGTLEQKTGSKGMAPFYDITGGDCLISVSVMGKLCETRTLYLDGTRVVVFKLEKYIVVGGYPLETTQLITGISLGILVASLVLALIYRRLRPGKVSEEGEKSL